MANSEPKDYDPNYVPQKQFFLVGMKAILLKDGKFLLLQRSEKAGGGGKWSLPGGGLDHDDTDPASGIVREIKEETTLEVTNVRPYVARCHAASSNDDYAVILGYQCEYLSGNVTTNWEHDNYKWVTKDEALALPLTSDGRFFVENFQS